MTASPVRKIVGVILNEAPSGGKFTIAHIENIFELTEGLGGWGLAKEYETGEIPPEFAKWIEAINSSRTGSLLKPLLICGTQVVNGINYAVICEQSEVTENPTRKIVNAILNVSPKQESSLLVEIPIIG